MKLQDLVAVSLRMVFRNRRRYRSVMIGIVIGTIGFILIRTLSDSVENRISGNLELIGNSTVLRAFCEDRRSPYHLADYLSHDAERLRAIPNVEVVAPVRFTRRDLKVQQKHHEAEGLQITFVDQHFWGTQSLTAIEGRLIDENDVRRRSQVCLLSTSAANDLFQGKSPVGKRITVKGDEYTVIGEIGGPENAETDRSIFVPLSLADRYLDSSRFFLRMYVRVDKTENVVAVRRLVEETLKASKPFVADGKVVRYNASRLDRINLIMFIVSMFGYLAITMIFILGKVGLTNVMMDALQLRTREIGLRKAVGATSSLIRAQFMLESMLVSSVAGLLGIVLATFVVFTVKRLMNLDVSNWVLGGSIAVDLTVTLAVGIAAGLYPARVASKLDVVTAMRFE